MDDTFIRWLASELAAVLTTPVARNQRLTVTGIFSSDRIRRLSASFGPLVQ